MNAKSIGLLVAVALAAALLQGCGRAKAPAKARVEVKPVSVAGAALAGTAPKFAPTDLYDKMAAEDAKVTANVPAYTVKPGLANVANAADFKPVLSPELIALIVKNGFGVAPTDYIQMFHVYENNEYQRPRKYPSFITTDSMLHTYHVFYDFTLRKVESDKLYDAAVKLTAAMLDASRKDVAAASNAQVKDAARRNLAYFAVARELLTDENPPASVANMAEADLEKIGKHEGRALSDVLGHKIDFSQFVPRGHYTRTEKLKKYFRAMMWYGLAPFPIPQGKIGPTSTRQALLIVRDLRSVTRNGMPAMKLWDMIYEPTAFYVGTADDYTVYQYAEIMESVYGGYPKVDDFGDKAKLDRFIAEVKKLPGPGIENFVAVSPLDGRPDPMFAVGRQFRFMGQRFIPDSRVMQELTHPKVGGRNFPKGLDVLAAMGSDRALHILDKTYEVNQFEGYAEQMAKMRKELDELEQPKWQSNLYYGWLWSLQSLGKPTPQGYPTFMRNDAWQDKSLFTALGSWTELRHDTILYGKQSVAECGGDGDEPPTPRGYVEPNLEFWTKLKWLNDYTRAGLDSRKLLNAELRDKFDKLGDWIEFCHRITVKELTGQKVTEEEYNQICLYGSELEALTLSFAEGDLLSDTDKDMAVVADVHTSFGSVLEEGTGRAAAIYVVVPIEGKLYLTRGATFTQYEFMHPASDRLTDEKWQNMLEHNQEPGLAGWIKTFYTNTEKKPAPEFANFFGGC